MRATKATRRGVRYYSLAIAEDGVDELEQQTSRLALSQIRLTVRPRIGVLKLGARQRGTTFGEHRRALLLAPA